MFFPTFDIGDAYFYFSSLFRSKQGKKHIRLFRKVAKAYAENKRFYHTLDFHIDFCLRELHKVPRELIKDFDSLELAVILHDVIMDFSRSDNEERSAQFARELCQEAGFSEEFAELVTTHILATKHNAIPENKDAQLLIDIDLEIFGQDWKKFSEYERRIRREYAFVAEDVFKRERAKILRQFLNRPSIFLTEYFQEKYEAQARANLKRSIAQLEK